MTALPQVRLRDLAGRYRLFLVDQFGVLHDGVAPYPGAVEALDMLKASGATVVILSNSGKRSASNMARLAKLGFEARFYDWFLSSGETAHGMLARGAVPGLSHRPGSVFIIARDRDTSPIDGLGIDLADAPDAADLILIAGSEAPVIGLDQYRALLAPAAAAGVPALCINPDMTMLVPGGMAFGAGRIARTYEEMGGRVIWIGKPYPAIYRYALSQMGLEASAAVGVGDSIEHDIAGAAGVGAAGALVLSGIHAEDSAEALAAHAAAIGVTPDWILPSFAW
jgi:HAD superfamily hydrolase (TIGR01459 family)